MREIVMPRRGAADVLQLREVAAPEPGAGQLAVRVEAAGVAFAEVQMLRGSYYQQPKFPFVPGYDLVGTVTAAGAGCRTAPGTRVAAMTRTGAWRETVLLDDSTVVAVPDGLAAAQAVALVTNGVTAQQLLRHANVHNGQTVLVHGAAGGVGSLLTRLAVRAGLRVLGTASPGKHDAVRAAGAEPVDRTGDVLAAVHALAPHGVHAVFDHVGGRSLHRSYRMLAPGGTLLCYGSAATATATNRFRPMAAMAGPITALTLRGVLGLGAGRRARIYSVRQDDRFRADLGDVLALAANGDLDAPVAGRYPLDRAAEALALLVDGRAAGKLVLEP